MPIPRNLCLVVLGLGAAITLPACADDTVAAPAIIGNEQAEPLALCLTMSQLMDADVVAADGTELGEVERVVTNSGDQVMGLIVEIEDSDPDRFVEISLEGLTSVRTGDDWALQGNLTRDQLAGLPSATL